MAHIVVVYHSGYGHTQRMAQAVAAGADAQLIAIDAEGHLPPGGWEFSMKKTFAVTLKR